MDTDSAFQAAVAKGMFRGLVSKEVRLSLPWPPTANHLFVNVPGRGRVRSKAYKAWAADAGWHILFQRPQKFGGPVTVSIDLHAPDKRRRDGDNLVKPILDVLVGTVIAADDNRIVRESKVKWVTEGPPCVVTVRSA